MAINQSPVSIREYHQLTADFAHNGGRENTIELIDDKIEASRWLIMGRRQNTGVGTQCVCKQRRSKENNGSA